MIKCENYIFCLFRSVQQTGKMALLDQKSFNHNLNYKIEKSEEFESSSR